MSILAALTTSRAFLIGIGVGIGVLVAFAAVAAGIRRPRRRPELDIPRAMQPGPADPDLERPVLERLIAWGAVFVVFMAIWIPVVWYNEPTTNLNDTKSEMALSVERGHQTTLPGTLANPLGFNCARCHGQTLGGGQNVFNGNIVAVPNLQTVCGGPAYGHAQIHGIQDIVATISEGRSGSDMPSWSVRFAGAMDDQQIQDLVNYILSIQKEPKDKNLCINPPKAG